MVLLRDISLSSPRVHTYGTHSPKRAARKDVQVAGVGTTKTGYVIRFKDQQSTDTARANPEWLEILGNGTKLVKPRYGVVVHRVPTVGFSIPENQKVGIRKIMEENDLAARGFNIDEIAWLKRPDKLLGMSASMGIWLDTADAAEWIVITHSTCARCQKLWSYRAGEQRQPGGQGEHRDEII